MSHTKAQALLVELQHYTNALILGDKPEPIEHVRGAVAGGPALLVENESAEHNSVGIEVHVGQEDLEVRNFAISATADQQGGIGYAGLYYVTEPYFPLGLWSFVAKGKDSGKVSTGYFVLTP